MKGCNTTMPAQSSYLHTDLRLAHMPMSKARTFRRHILRALAVLVSLAGHASAQGYSVSGMISNGPNTTVRLSGAAPVLIQSANSATPSGNISGAISFGSPTI
jgi:hypothetical protein